MFHNTWKTWLAIAILLSTLPGCAHNDLSGFSDRIVIPHHPSESGPLVLLGKALFFDKKLSRNHNISCATCHQPSKGFSDGQRFSKGTHEDVLKRNTPSLYNLAWNRFLFWDGRAQSLEKQALKPIQEPTEMDLDLTELSARLKADPFYSVAFERVFPQSGINSENVARALAAFERTIIAANSPFDHYVAGNQAALSSGALLGLNLFKGKAQCVECHSGVNFTDDDFHNTGVVTDDLGRERIDRAARREGDMTPYPFFSNHKAFKTPGLRNVALSAPYFHDGSEPDLLHVVQFYNQGGKSKDKMGRAFQIKPLGLSPAEETHLVAFLKALTSPVPMDPPTRGELSALVPQGVDYRDEVKSEDTAPGLRP